MFYSLNDCYVGLKIIKDNEPHIIISNEFVKPGKGKAFNRIKIKNLFSDKIIEKIFKSNDLIEVAHVLDINATYLYNDRKFWYFMNVKTFEQFIIDIKIIKKNTRWLFKQIECTLTLWNDKVIIVTLPNFIELQVLDTDPSMKGNAIHNNIKLAKLNTGTMIKVPAFIKKGDIIKIDTRSSSYISRIKTKIV